MMSKYNIIIGLIVHSSLISSDTSPSLKQHCRHFQQNGVDIFRFEVPSRRSIDEWLLYMDTAYRNLPEGRPMRMVLDYRLRGLPHLSYATQRARQWIKAHPDAPQTHAILLHNSYALATIIDGVVRLMHTPSLNLRFFHKSHSDDAFNWLREQN